MEEYPTCDDTGICVAPARATGVTNCIHCGKELIQCNGQWYTWDTDLKGRRVLPQKQESE